MTPPSPIWLFHFTHVEHLRTITRHGLMCDTQVGTRLANEAGEPEIKERRRAIHVPAGHGGVVGDYVPFYFGPRSPMLFRIAKGGVPSYHGSQTDLVYICTTVEHLLQSGTNIVLSDRNAATSYADFTADPARWRQDGFIDWPLMQAQMWNNDPDHPDRMERRMAECLVHRVVPWDDVLAIGVRDDTAATRVQAMMQGAAHQPPVVVRPRWYF